MKPTGTVFHVGPVKTGITDETYSIDNRGFLRVAFGDGLEAAKPVLVSFKGNPGTVPRKAWFGRPWQGVSDLMTDLPANANNYFSLAIFSPDEAGRYRRQKAHFQSLYTVMLDDVGTKVPKDRLTLAPSWLLETSPGISCENPFPMVLPPTD